MLLWLARVVKKVTSELNQHKLRYGLSRVNLEKQYLNDM